MKKYSIDGYSIIDNMPYMFQISTKDNSYRLVQYPLKGDYPYRIKIQKESFNKQHAILYTPGIFMEISWIDDENEPNGQITMGIRTPKASMDFVHWTALINNVPERVILLAYHILTKSALIKEYEVPLFKDPDNNTNTNNNSRNKTRKNNQRRLRNV